MQTIKIGVKIIRSEIDLCYYNNGVCVYLTRTCAGRPTPQLLLLQLLLRLKLFQVMNRLSISLHGRVGLPPQLQPQPTTCASRSESGRERVRMGYRTLRCMCTPTRLVGQFRSSSSCDSDEMTSEAVRIISRASIREQTSFNRRATLRGSFQTRRWRRRLESHD